MIVELVSIKTYIHSIDPHI